MRRPSLAILLAGALAGPASAQPAGDPRFFGEYCGSARFDHCVRVRACLWPFNWPCIESTRCENVHLAGLRATVDYEELLAGGSLRGTGRGTMNGQPLFFSFGGLVVRPGLADGSLASNYFHAVRGNLALSGDGLALSTAAMGHGIVLRKDTCGNSPPVVRVSVVAAPTALNRRAVLEGVIVRDETPDIPDRRLSFTSSLIGALGGARVRDGRTLRLETDPLPAGRHVITFAATDRGGLTGRVSVEVRVPTLPIAGILRFPEDLLFTTTQPTAVAVDFDDDLSPCVGAVARKVRWSVSADGQSYRTVGEGARASLSLKEAGRQTLRAELLDGQEVLAKIERPITVVAVKGNERPRVAIIRPAETPGCTLRAGAVVVLEGAAEDREDRSDRLETGWTATRLDVQAPSIQASGRLARVRLEAGPKRRASYRLRFWARDTGGGVAEAERLVQVEGGGQQPERLVQVERGGKP
jgi:hypothetical protein